MIDAFAAAEPGDVRVCVGGELWVPRIIRFSQSDRFLKHNAVLALESEGREAVLTLRDAADQCAGLLFFTYSIRSGMDR